MENLLGRDTKSKSKTKSGFTMPRKSRLVETTVVVNADALKKKKGGKLYDITGSITPVKERKENAWLLHLKAYRAKHPDLSLKMAMSGAKSTYDNKKKKKK